MIMGTNTRRRPAQRAAAASVAVMTRVGEFDGPPLDGIAAVDFLQWFMRHRGGYLLIKRCLDVCLVLVALLLAAPLLVLVALLVKLDDGGPVLYRREVLGRYDAPFFILKFRTMVANADQILAADPLLQEEYRRQNFKLRRDPRVTRVGRLLRRTSLDELPQLWNILRGHMSLVGPRSIHVTERELYGDFYAVRRCLRPGLTGLWQVSGRSDTTYDERIRLDQEYMLRCSLRRDFSILLRTVAVVMSGKGAY
jgi:exopolysaccharide production protein ExoY